ncbi:succinyldiaminopimelate transaminase [Corynebacterium bovis]|uniref:succinyldiaminopimelate transaminase n=1 Tax=Corynebacterium bovis TaxID=36808 RepID=UPI003139CAD6
MPNTSRPARRPAGSLLPDFPWDALEPAWRTARSHPGGMIDLSVGTPVDPVAPAIQLALAEAGSAPGYPQTKGTPELRAAIVGAMERRFGVTGLDPETGVLPVIGTKEAIAWLPTLLGTGEGHDVVIPELAYPTYEVAARLAGAGVVRSDAPWDLDRVPSLVFINSPANPHGAVLGVGELRRVVGWAREHDVIVVSDECYLGLGWEEAVDGSTATTAPVSVLDPRVCDGDHRQLLAVHSLSKTSNLASYRAGFLAGDTGLIAELLSVRRHAGLMVPGPIQAAMTTALSTDDQEILQKELYRSRRRVLADALHAAGFTVDRSEAGLYLWVTEGAPCRETVDRFAAWGILVAPGEFYGPAGVRHVRIGLTGTNEAVHLAAERLAAVARAADGN